MYKFFFIIHACTEKRKRKRSLGCARDDDTERAAPFLSSHLGSQPPPLRGTSFRGKEGVCRLLASSFRAKARNLFRLRSGKRGEDADHGKHRTLCGVESRCFMQTALRRKTETANEKDPSTALGMTIRERAVSHSLSSRSGSEPPPLRGTSFRGKEGVCRLPPSPLFPI